VIVELDGRALDDHEDAFERDREKAAALVAAGWCVVPLTWDRVVRRPVREAARLRRLVGSG